MLTLGYYYTFLVSGYPISLQLLSCDKEMLVGKDGVGRIYNIRHERIDGYSLIAEGTLA